MAQAIEIVLTEELKRAYNSLIETHIKSFNSPTQLLAKTIREIRRHRKARAIRRLSRFLRFNLCNLINLWINGFRIKTLRESKAKLSELVDLASEGQDVLAKARLTAEDGIGDRGNCGAYEFIIVSCQSWDYGRPHESGRKDYRAAW